MKLEINIMCYNFIHIHVNYLQADIHLGLMHFFFPFFFQKVLSLRNNALSLCMLAYFEAFLLSAYFFLINLIQKLFQEYQQRAKQFGSRSGLTADNNICS